MTVVVTGAAGAIGAAVVQAFVEHGTTVVAQDLRKPDFNGTTVVPIEGDLRDPDCLRRLHDAVAETGASAVVAAHGIFNGSGPLASLKSEPTKRLIAVNFAALPALLSATLEPLKAGRGTFVAVASQAALRGEPDNSVYAASKWAVRAWAQSCDRLLRDDGVRVRSICPGRTSSPLLESALETFAAAAGMSREDYEAQCLALIPARSFGTPAAIAAAVSYLVSSSARPSVLAVNGGEVPW